MPEKKILVTYKIYGYAVHKKKDYPKLKISIIRQFPSQNPPTLMGRKAYWSFVFYYSEFFMSDEGSDQPIPVADIDAFIEGFDEIKREELE